MSDSYYNKDYNLNPKIREMIEKRMGKIYDLSFVQIENVVNGVYKGEYNKEKTYTENDKNKIISMFKETSPNRMDNDSIVNLNSFMSDKMTSDEYKDYLEYCIKMYYRPGMVYSGVRISNKGVMEIINLSNLYDLKQGVIINKKYVNDLLPLFNNDSTKIDYNEKTLMTDVDYTDYITGLVNGMKFNYNIDYFNTPELFIIVGNDENTVTFLNEKVGIVQDVLDFTYYEPKEEEMDEMQLAPGISMKGNFTKLGNIGGTQVIGVGGGTGNSLLDKLAADDAMSKLNKILNGGDDDDDDDDDDNGGDDDGDNTGFVNDSGGGNNDDGKIDCNDPNYPNRSVLERIFASKEWKEEKHLPKSLKTPKGWGDSETMFDDYNDSEELVSNPKSWKKDHSWDSCFVHPNAESFQGQKVKAFWYVVTGPTDRDINVFMVGDEIIGWYYHED